MAEENALLRTLAGARESSDRDPTMGEMGRPVPRIEIDAADISLIVERHREIAFQEGHDRGSQLRSERMESIRKAAFDNAVYTVTDHLALEFEAMLDDNFTDTDRTLLIEKKLEELREVREAHQPSKELLGLRNIAASGGILG